jgi:DNA-binding CsgD family transcriptional regulator/PAS domain-containing protein
MPFDFERQFQRYLALFEAQEFDERQIDYTHLDRHLAFLRQIAAVENSSIAVMDLFRRRYAFMQSKFLPMLGIELEEVMRRGPMAIYQLMHPDDVSTVIDTLYRGNEFLLQLPAADKKSYKIIYDFRLRTKRGDYVRFLQQLVPLELDGKGNIWLMLMVNDTVPDRAADARPHRKVVHLQTGKECVFDQEEDRRSRLTKREIEVLELLAKGLPSKKIADELFLSVNTVNNHRRNILEKTSAENTAEALRYAMSLGLI